MPHSYILCVPGIEIDEGPELHGPLDPVSISPYRLNIIFKHSKKYFKII